MKCSTVATVLCTLFAAGVFALSFNHPFVFGQSVPPPVSLPVMEAACTYESHYCGPATLQCPDMIAEDCRLPRQEDECMMPDVITPKICVPGSPWFGDVYCVHQGIECYGHCDTSGIDCFAALSMHCSSDYYWFW